MKMKKKNPYQSPVSQNNYKCLTCNVLLPPPTTWMRGWILGGKGKTTIYKKSTQKKDLFTNMYIYAYMSFKKKISHAGCSWHHATLCSNTALGLCTRALYKPCIAT